MFDDLRVLDLTGEIGVYCGKLLADLGAEVIKVEPPGGDPMRCFGPFAGDEPHPERSLHWWFFNTNKKSITLNIEAAAGRRIFMELAKTADIVLETFPPGHLDELGIGYARLCRDHPSLIMTSITPFGQTGPHRGYQASNIVGCAMGGQMFLTGIPGEPPMQAGEDQGYFQAGLHAAVGTLIAVHHRDGCGEGQQVDVSMQEAITLSTEFAINYWDLEHHVRTRTGIDHRIPGYGTYQCSDGWVFLTAGFNGWERLVDWIQEGGWGLELDRDDSRRGNADETDAVLITWFLQHTRQQVVDALQGRHVGAMPVNSPDDVYRSPQLAARGFFVELDHPELGAKHRYPGAPYRFSETQWSLARPAPTIGEHTDQILRELGLSSSDLDAYRADGVI